MKKINIHTLSTKPPSDIDVTKIQEKTAFYIRKNAKMQEAMFAERKHTLEIWLQGMDASGKDGTVKHVIKGINPSGVTVKSYKVPTEEEYSHDFLWRIHKDATEKGKIGVSNRTVYEDILVPTVHKLFPMSEIKKRYHHINNYESLRADTGTTILKFFLHISPEEQQKRFRKRMKNPKKLWKFKRKDVNESKHWDQYMEVYQEIFNTCPGWIIVPADDKYYRNYIIAKTIYETLKKFKCKFPNKIAG